MSQTMNRLALITGGGAAVILGAAFVAFLLVGFDGAGGSGLNASAEQPPAEGQTGEAPLSTDDGEAADREAANAIARQAREWGIARCSREIALVSEFLTQNAVYSARSMRGPHDPDGEVFSATIVARTQDGGGESLSTMTVAPVSAGRCNVVYETTAHFDSPCDTIRQVQFTNFVQPIEFGGLALAFATQSGDGQLYMMPSGEGCLVKKTQALY